MQQHIAGTRRHVVARGESLWELTRQQYALPLWLLRQYNPELNLDRVQPGDQVVFPRVERVQAMGPEGPAMADGR